MSIFGKLRQTVCCVAALTAFGSPAGHAQAAAEHGSEEPVVTHHTLTVQGHELSYTARAGYLSILDEEHVVHGRMFYTAYTLDQPPSSAPRPLLFAWNGGPGSNASLQELGALGPRRLDKPGGQIVDNPDTWLSFADLVFVDPINTGYSYATSPEHLTEFTNDQGDADSVAEFIRLYRRHFGVADQPLFIEGESYGTFRAAGVAEILSARKIPLRGIIMLSTVLKLRPEITPELRAVFELPNYVATAWFHHRLSPELEKSLEATTAEAQRWAESDYLEALVLGDRLAADKKKQIAERLTRYTGVPAEIWLSHDLMLSEDAFAEDVLGPGKLQYVGHYDTRVTGTMAHPGESWNVAADPSLNNGVEEVIPGYLDHELGWKSDAFYAGPFGGRWPSPDHFRGDWASVRWGRDGDGLDRGAALASALRSTPGLRVLIASGYYDFSTPYAQAEYTIAHLGLSPELRKRIEFEVYPGGHAAYLEPAVRVKFAAEVKAFIASDLAANAATPSKDAH